MELFKGWTREQIREWIMKEPDCDCSAGFDDTTPEGQAKLSAMLKALVEQNKTVDKTEEDK